MPFDFGQIFGVHAQALTVRARRSELLTTNLANADTPHFKARDIDFRQALAQTAATGGMPMQRTDSRHMRGRAAAPGGDALYRIPFQPSLDGNTVEADVELAAFAENAIRYQATLRFLNGRIKGLKDAITGG